MNKDFYSITIKRIEAQKKQVFNEGKGIKYQLDIYELAKEDGLEELPELLNLESKESISKKYDELNEKLQKLEKCMNKTISLANRSK